MIGVSEISRNPQDELRQPRRARRAAALAVWSLLVGIVWLVLLPAVARQPAFRSDLRRLREQGINPSAMYYTELEMMGEVIDHNERFRREHPAALWVP